MEQKSSTALLRDRSKAVSAFADEYFRKLSDSSLIDELAERDMEKLTRIFKTVFELLRENEEAEENRTLLSLIEAVNSLGGDRDG